MSGASILSTNLSLKCKLQAKKMPLLPRPRWGISICAKKKSRGTLWHVREFPVEGLVVA